MRFSVRVFDKATDKLLTTLTPDEFKASVGWTKDGFVQTAIDTWNRDASKPTRAAYVVEVQKRGRWIEI